MGISPAQVFERPTADHIWLGAAQKAALAYLSHPAPGCTKLLLGPSSCGKSTVVDRYLSTIENTVFFRSNKSWTNATELLDSLLDSPIVCDFQGADDERREQFRAYLSEKYWLGKDVLLVIDNAEHLTTSGWQEICRLSLMLFDDGVSRADVLVVGHSNFQEFLKSIKAFEMTEIPLSVHKMPALNPSEAELYVKHRMRSVGLPDSIFSATSLNRIGELSAGSFNTANLLCQISLGLLKRRSVTIIDDKLVQDANNVLNNSGNVASARKFLAPDDHRYTGEVVLRRSGTLCGRYKLLSRTLVGRGPRNHIRLESPDVSRVHGAIFSDRDDFFVEDLGSINGIAVNGEIQKKIKLSDRDVISVGPFQLTFVAPLSKGRPLQRKSAIRADGSSLKINHADANTG